MWVVYEKVSLTKTLCKVPKEVVKHYELWKRVIEIDGIMGLHAIRGFRDEALKGTLKGYRSSRLNRLWRVIYKINSQAFEVYVVDVNPHIYIVRA